MKMALTLLAPAALLPVAGLGLWLWRDQAPMIWLAGFFAACL